MYGKPQECKVLTILSTQPYTQGVNVGVYHDLGVGFPAAMDGANLTLEASPTGAVGSFKPVNGIAVPVVLGEITLLRAPLLQEGISALGWIRFKSDANETADRSIELYCGA